MYRLICNAGIVSQWLVGERTRTFLSVWRVLMVLVLPLRVSDVCFGVVSIIRRFSSYVFPFCLPLIYSCLLYEVRIIFF